MSCRAQRTMLTSQLKESTFILSSLVVNVTTRCALIAKTVFHCVGLLCLLYSIHCKHGTAYSVLIIKKSVS